MSSGEAADFAAGAGAAVADCVAAVVFGAVATLAGAVAGFATGATAVVGAWDDEDFVSTALATTGVAGTDRATVVAVAGASGAALTAGAALGIGALASVNVTGAFDGAAQPEINSAKNVAISPATGIENIFLQGIFGPISNQQCLADIIGGKLASEGQLKSP